MSLGVLLHPEHRLEVEASRVGRICRVIDLGSIKVSSADGQSFAKSESNISVRSFAAGIPPAAGQTKSN